MPLSFIGGRVAVACFVLGAAAVGGGCGHRRAKAPPSAAARERPDFSRLSLTDVRLATEAMAYDLGHGPHAEAARRPGGLKPILALCAVPDQVAPQGLPFPKEQFVDSLAQAVRNGGVYEVADKDTAPEGQLCFNLAVSHASQAIEGMTARVYTLTARLGGEGRPVLWQSDYIIRKRHETAPDAAPEVP